MSVEPRDLEQDIKNSFIAEKGRDNDLYCQHLYAALCNNDFVPLETMAVLSQDYWSCSWRSAGGIASDIKSGTIDGGHYMEYYCSGLKSDKYDSPKCYAGEGEVREEIRDDLVKIGWAVVGNNGYIDKYQ